MNFVCCGINTPFLLMDVKILQIVKLVFQESISIQGCKSTNSTKVENPNSDCPALSHINYTCPI